VKTVALIGPDGTGKTTIARALVDSEVVPMKYLYMGMSIESSNVALPTSRLVHRLELAKHARSLRQSQQPVPEEINLHGLEHRFDRRGRLGAIARLLHRLSEEIYRQLISWSYQRRGYVVVYDRHFIFDMLPGPEDLGTKRRLTERIHNWFLSTVYPTPDVVMFLDAPPEVLHARKQEVPEWYLQQNRENLEEKREYAKEWIVIDASQPLELVIEQIATSVADRVRITV
jgi:thymidylate kinase